MRAVCRYQQSEDRVRQCQGQVLAVPSVGQPGSCSACIWSGTCSGRSPTCGRSQSYARCVNSLVWRVSPRKTIFYFLLSPPVFLLILFCLVPRRKFLYSFDQSLFPINGISMLDAVLLHTIPLPTVQRNFITKVKPNEMYQFKSSPPYWFRRALTVSTQLFKKENKQTFPKPLPIQKKITTWSN